MESAVEFYSNLKAEFHDTCDVCNKTECPCHKSNLENTDYCDDYVPYYFEISK
jgi:hypothetical protein